MPRCPSMFNFEMRRGGSPPFCAKERLVRLLPPSPQVPLQLAWVPGPCPLSTVELIRRRRILKPHAVDELSGLQTLRSFFTCENFVMHVAERGPH